MFVAEHLVPAWVWTLPNASLVTLVCELWDKLRAKSLSEKEREQQERLERAERQLRESAEKDAQKPVKTTSLQLGTYIVGDYFGQETGVYLERNRVCLTESVHNQHMFILGQPGSGKTETQLRVIYEMLFKTDRDVFFVDGKGESPTANAFRKMAVAAGRGEVPVFRLGQSTPGALYNGFRGSKEAIYERLAAMIGVTEKEGDPYWRKVDRELLQLITGYSHDYVEAPRSFEELWNRVSLSWLRYAVHAAAVTSSSPLPRNRYWKYMS